MLCKMNRETNPKRNHLQVHLSYGARRGVRLFFQEIDPIGPILLPLCLPELHESASDSTDAVLPKSSRDVDDTRMVQPRFQPRFDVQGEGVHIVSDNG